MAVVTAMGVVRVRDRRNPYRDVSLSIARTMAIAQGRPVPDPAPEPPVPLRCPACRHFTVRHTGEPGRGCRHRGCLCLETPHLICQEAIR